MNPVGLAQQALGGAAGGAAGKAAALFTKQHNDVYEKLRNVLMGLHGQGVPGMDNVLKALNNEHVNQTKNMVPGAMSPSALSVQAAGPRPQRPDLQGMIHAAGQAADFAHGTGDILPNWGGVTSGQVPSAMGGAMGQITPGMIQALQAVRGGGAPTFSGGQVPDGSATY